MVLQGKEKWVLTGILLLSFIMHFRVFTLNLVGYHVWRQVQTQTQINNFTHEDFNILNPRINDKYREDRTMRLEFPIMQWLIAGICRVVGNEVLVGRLSIFILGLFSVFGMYKLAGILFKDSFTALVCAWAFNFSPLFYYYTVNPMPDNFALCMGIWAIVYFLKWKEKVKLYYVVLSAAFFLLSISSKLPYIIFYAFLIPFFLFNPNRKRKVWDERKLRAAIIYFVFAFGFIAWYAWVIPKWDRGSGSTLGGMIASEKSAAELIDIFVHNLISSFPELLLNYGCLGLFLSGAYFVFKNRKYGHPEFSALCCWAIVTALYFLYEMSLIAKVHDYYLLPFLPLIFLVVSYGAKQLMYSKQKGLHFFVVLSLLILPLTAYLRMDGRWNAIAPGFTAGFYSHQEELRKLVPDDELCVVGSDESHVILLYYIDKKGWSVDNNTLTLKNMDRFVNMGAKYFYTDQAVDTCSFLLPVLREKIFEKDGVRVYKLKVD
jgi:hypothetical protein